MNKAQEFIKEMQRFLGLEIWQFSDKYIIAGPEFTLGEAITDILNINFKEFDKAYQNMDLAASKLSDKRLTAEVITSVQENTNLMLDMLFESKPYKLLSYSAANFKNVLTDYYGDRLSNPHAHFTRSDWEVFESYYMRFYVIRADVLRIQLVYTDFLDNYILRDGKTVSCGYERFLDDLQTQKTYRDIYEKEYPAARLFELTSPLVVDFGVPPKDSNAPEICEVLSFVSLFDFARWEIMKALTSGIAIKRCKWCGRFFAHGSGPAYEYCDKVAPNETERTCRMVGSMRSHAEKVKNDPVWAVYRRAYKKYHARVVKRTMTHEDFLAWANEALELRDKALAREMSADELEAQLNKL